MRSLTNEQTSPAALLDHYGGRGTAIVFFMQSFGAGGEMQVFLALANELAERGHSITVAVCDPSGPLRQRLTGGIEVVDLKHSSSWEVRRWVWSDKCARWPLLASIILEPRLHPSLASFIDLARVLRERRPQSLYSAGAYANTAAHLACRMAEVLTRLVVSEHNTLRFGHPLSRGRHHWVLPPMIRYVYAHADAIVAVSQGVADDLVARTGLPAERITVVYNPVVPRDLAARMAEPTGHPWFEAGQPPVILSASRLTRSKDLPTLVHAFAKVRQEREARLVILGGAKSPQKTQKVQKALREFALSLGVAGDVSLPGYVGNPFAYMAKASVFVLSSIHEGFGNGLAEALACGCAVVSTDCPSGPAEILAGGTYGRLVPVRNPSMMAQAIVATLTLSPDRNALRARGGMFHVGRVADEYERLLIYPRNLLVSRMTD